jgi:hypothetical protein
LQLISNFWIECPAPDNPDANLSHVVAYNEVATKDRGMWLIGITVHQFLDLELSGIFSGLAVGLTRSLGWVFLVG